MKASESPPVIHWFRRDLRLTDNLALLHATQGEKEILPVYICSSWKNFHSWTGPRRQEFLCGCLASLDKNLRIAGSRLIVRQGDAVTELAKLVNETGASSIYFNLDPDPFGKGTEARLSSLCTELGIACHGFADVALHAPGEILTQTGQPYRVFTAYYNKWISAEKAAPLPRVARISTPQNITSLALPTLATWDLPAPTNTEFPAGEKAAHSRLRHALAEKIPYYSHQRDLPALAATSHLSADLRFGTLSPRLIYSAVTRTQMQASYAAQKSFEIFIKELAWRDFYFSILHHFPQVLNEEFNETWRGIPWEEPGEKFEAWKQGRTGFPLVDAGMRQLAQTGFMHNRLRMITAMFLCKDLHHNWMLGEAWFMQTLVDGDIAANNGGWQWSAGTGADAAPYFRIQNPWTQTANYDSCSNYIKQWIPELQHVESKLLQAPPKDNKHLAPDYPLPILDHKTEREKTLRIFNLHRALVSGNG